MHRKVISLKSNPFPNNILFLGMTGAEGNVENYLDSGANRVLLKPNDTTMANLHALVESLDAQGMPTDRILIVDDDAGIRNVLNIIFLRSGKEVKVAQNPKEAAELVTGQDWLPDMILSDHDMPEMTGSEFVARIRAGTPIK